MSDKAVSMTPWLDAYLASAEARREFEQERLVQEITAALAAALEDADVTQAEVAKRLGRSAPYVSQVLSGRRNFTLHTIADLAWASGVRIAVRAEPITQSVSAEFESTQSSVLPLRRIRYEERSPQGAPTQPGEDALLVGGEVAA